MSAWAPGLCSVTFRQLEPEAIIDRAAKAGLKAIEWGSDKHILPGDTTRAAAIASACRDAGLACPTLGSYARGTGSDRSQPFAPLLDIAEALGAETIRVWAGEAGFAETPDAERRAVAEAIHGYAEAAQARGLRIALEYHPNTLTDCREGALWLLAEARHPALFSYWQPVPDQPIAECAGDLVAIGDRLAHLHVFHWKGERIRYPMAEATDYWAALFKAAPAPAGGYAFLEFVPEDDPDRLAAEAAALTTCLTRAAET